MFQKFMDDDLWVNEVKTYNNKDWFWQTELRNKLSSFSIVTVST